ncbi:MAG: OmpA family protein [Rhodospirillales bacterium]
MANHHTRVSRLNKNPFKTALLIGAFMGASVLGACSQVPDAVNPAAWYRGTVDLFSGDKKEEEKKKNGGLAADRGKAPPGSEKPFPNLASVDKQAKSRDNISGGLSADRERPKYAPAIKRQAPSTETVPTKPPAAPSMVSGPTPPPPAAAPTTPVTPVPTTVPAPKPPVMATRQPAMPKLEPPTLTPDQQATEERLRKQLQDIRRQAEATPDLPAPSLPAKPGEKGTIVITSEGVQTQGAMAAAAPAPQTMPPPETPPSSQLAAPGSAPLPLGPGVKVATILFDNGSAKLKAHDKRILSAVTRLQRQRGGTIRIVGHASSRTRNLPPVKHKMANFQISAARADKVYGELVRLGVKKGNIVIAAVSDQEPLYYEFMPSGEAGNRRTEVYLVN